MTKLPPLSGRRVVAMLGKIGYQVDHQTGSHVILRHTDPPYRRVTVPDHKTLAKGTLRAIIREAGLSRDDFLALL